MPLIKDVFIIKHEESEFAVGFNPDTHYIRITATTDRKYVVARVVPIEDEIKNNKIKE